MASESGDVLKTGERLQVSTTEGTSEIVQSHNWELMRIRFSCEIRRRSKPCRSGVPYLGKEGASQTIEKY